MSGSPARIGNCTSPFRSNAKGSAGTAGSRDRVGRHQEQIRAAQDVVERVEVRSPVRGIVVKRHFHTAGGVVTPGAVILELLPVQEELLIEARLNPANVVHVTVGQNALARISALNQQITPMLEAKVVYVSADVLPEQTPQTKNGQDARKDYYVVRVRLDADDVRHRMYDFQADPRLAGRCLY